MVETEDHLDEQYQGEREREWRAGRRWGEWEDRDALCSHGAVKLHLLRQAVRPPVGAGQTACHRV